MPTVYTEAVWRALYKKPLPQRHLIDGTPVITQPPLTYSRDFEWFTDSDPNTLTPVRGVNAPRHQTRKDWLTGYGLDNNARVLFIGCAYGFLMEYAIDAGINQVWGIEPSPWIWANTGEIRADVLPKIVNATVGVDSVASIQTLLAAAGMGNPRRGDWIVDEDAISSQSNDTEIAAFLSACESLLQGNAKGRIVHIVTPGDPLNPGDSACIWQPMSWWKAKAPDHTWVDANTGTVA